MSFSDFLLLKERGVGWGGETQRGRGVNGRHVHVLILVGGGETGTSIMVREDGMRRRRSREDLFGFLVFRFVVGISLRLFGVGFLLGLTGSRDVSIARLIQICYSCQRCPD